ncbi:ShlB/FhaC/HecB family hemolysin secretion/activation protein [Spirulina major CS-329]|uniref:ShlB/FhaC/HecB family hemolysin secretion/activation protein n=1 Tax=Spirulina TaxID=1154 RepID=UPI00233001DE|nr:MULTISPECIES: ShlB/FhaC/HecB family hemolysin secretion/activation protein [Spirulina]MDB9494734.1 ShlB/FhaC/HecB family hemolysin secretion/activation protein [Spirulina subsalsa CS-330]MDB9502649.1 ShlB/FhaC/HecB family hemolysin secretion/activation protein [Spirulina major CS-329]
MVQQPQYSLVFWGTTCLTTLLCPTSEATPFQAISFPTLIAQIPESNDERFLQPNEAPPQPLEGSDRNSIETPPTTPTATPTNPLAPEPGPIRVNRLKLTDSSLFSLEDFQTEFAPFIGQQVSEASLQRLADLVTERYLSDGYITSRAILNPESFDTGTIEIIVLEGGIENIEVEGTNNLKPGYILKRVALGARTPLNTGRLEDQLRLLRTDPLIENIEASLRSGTEPAKSILVVRVTEARQFRGAATVDNYSPPSVGSERMGVNLSYQNLTGAGDELSGGMKRTTRGGSDTFDLSYRYPLNAMDGTLQLRASFNRNNVVQEPFNILDIRGNSELYEISYRQPLQRTPREEFALSMGLTYQTGQTFTFAGPTPFGFGPEADGSTTTTVLKFGQDYIRRDARGAWAVRSQFSLGLDLLEATRNSGSIPDGQFLSWLGQIQRAQVLNENNFLILSADLQYAFSPLLPSQQFVMGGGQSVRGFRQNVRAGDNGIRFSAEDRITLVRDEAGSATLVFAPFLDFGWVWNAQNNPNSLAAERFIAGLGAGLIWNPYPDFTVRFDYGLPLVDLDDRGTNAQDDGFYFSVIWRF